MYDTVIFDLDGTLLNTVSDLTGAVNAALKHMGYPERTEDEVRNFIGNGSRRLIERALPADADEIKAKETLKFFKEYYAANVCIDTEPFPGIMEMLDTLKAKGVNISIISNKYYTAVNELKEIFFKDYTDIALGESSCIRKKPDPTAIKMVMKLLKSENAVYIGDSIVDAQTADNAGIPCILVDWGYGKHIESAGAMSIAGSADELCELILKGQSH